MKCILFLQNVVLAVFLSIFLQLRGINDLDFSGKEWTPVQEISLTLNGAGHKIEGLPSVLCRRLTGTIKDLTIDADINMTEGVMAAAFAEQLNGEGASLETCVSEGQIVLSNSSAFGKAALAGLAVQVDAGAKLINCSNIFLSICPMQLKLS